MHTEPQLGRQARLGPCFGYGMEKIQSLPWKQSWSQHGTTPFICNAAILGTSVGLHPLWGCQSVLSPRQQHRWTPTLEAGAGTPAVPAEDHDWPLQDTSLGLLTTESSVYAEGLLTLLKAVGKRALGIHQVHQEWASCDSVMLPTKRRDISKPFPCWYLVKEMAQISPPYISHCNSAHDVCSPLPSILVAALSDDQDNVSLERKIPMGLTHISQRYNSSLQIVKSWQTSLRCSSHGVKDAYHKYTYLAQKQLKAPLILLHLHEVNALVTGELFIYKGRTKVLKHMCVVTR